MVKMMSKNFSDQEETFPICDGVEVVFSPSDDSRKVFINVKSGTDLAIGFEPNKKQLQRLIRNLKHIENGLKG